MTAPRLALAALLFALPLPALASTPPERVLAETLFKEARKLSAAGKTAEACAKFEESQHLDPAPGTLINLAVCHEALGKTATAWGELNESLDVARKQKRADRETIALAHLAAVEPRLSRLTIVVPADAELPGLQVALDGIAIGNAALGTAFPVDPGVHHVVVRAEGRAPLDLAVTIGAERDAQTVRVPKLAEAKATPVDAPIGSGAVEPAKAAAATVPAPPDAAPTPPRDEVRSSADGRAQRTWGYVAFGAGVAAAGVGAFYGLRAHARRTDADAARTAGDESTAQPLYDDARSNVTPARLALGLGAAATIGGLVLVLTAPHATEGSTAATAWRLAPMVGVGTAGATIGGAF
ncbi:MAG: hypothetical protein NVS3B10_05280 [Polyangiales bacterium]